MNYFQYFFYGLVQGITEFFPISSSAHLKILSEFFNLEDPGYSLSAIIQIGSVVAILFFFKKELNRSLMKISNIEARLFKLKIFKSLLIGTISILIFGSFIKFTIPNFYSSFLRSNLLIGLTSIFSGVIMLISEFTKSKNISLTKHNFIDSFFIGLAQSFAIIPGVSRSGITISAALFLGWNRVDAAKYSFLLGIPAILISSMVEIYSSVENNSIIYFGPLILALISSFIVSFLSIKFLIRYFSFKGLKIFIYYKIIFGILVLIEEYGLLKIIY